MKKFHLAFGIITLAVIAAGILHGGVAWIVAAATWDPFATSFPAWVAFVLPLFCYSLAALIVLLAWLLSWIILRGIWKNRLQKADKDDIIKS